MNPADNVKCQICFDSEMEVSNPIIKMCASGHLGHRECVKLIYEQKDGNEKSVRNGKCPFNDSQDILLQYIYSPCEIFKNSVSSLTNCAKSYAAFSWKDLFPSLTVVPYIFRYTTEEYRIAAEYSRASINERVANNLEVHGRDIMNVIIYDDSLKVLQKLPRQCAFLALTIYALTSVII